MMFISLAPLLASWKTHLWKLLISCDGWRSDISSIMRSSSRCGVLGCHLCCSTSLSFCHSFCLLPASAHSTVRCHSTCPATGVCIAYCKALTQQRRQEESSQWIERSQVTHTTAVSLPVFVAARAHEEQSYTWKASPCLDSKAFPQAARAQMEHFLTSSLSRSPPYSENVNVVMCGGWSGILWAVSLVIKR